MYQLLVKRHLRPQFDRLSAGDYDSVLRGVDEPVHHRFAGEHPLGGERHTKDGLTLIGDINVQATVLYQGYVSKADAVHADKRSWTVADADHNRHYALVEGELQAELAYQFAINGEDATLDFDNVVHLSGLAR